MLDRPLSMVTPRPSPRWLVGAHLVAFGLASWALIQPGSIGVIVVAAIVAGTSRFALTSLARAASLDHPTRRRGWIDWCNLVLGWSSLTPITAVRAFESTHRRATNAEVDPNCPLRSRWMLLVGAPIAVALIHRHTLRTRRGGALVLYLLESAVMLVAVGAAVAWLPRLIGARAFWLPVGLAALGQNIRIVAEHVDLPVGRFRDTWQLALPGPLSRWLLHVDHHLERHLRPDLGWHELPLYRAEIVRSGFVPPDHQLTTLGLARVILGKRRSTQPTGTTTRPRWAGRAAIRARPRRPNHPSREPLN